MIFSTTHTKTWALLLFCLAVPFFVFSQRKKKEEPQAANTKLREAEFYFTEGEKFFILEDYSKALLYYQRALEINSGNATIHYKIAEVLARSNRQEDLLRASLSMENALQLEKRNKYFYIQAASIYTSLARFDDAARVYETMLKEVPGTEEYYYELAAIYQYANKFDEAIRVYTKAETVLGVNEISSLQKQRLYLDQGKTREAITEADNLMQAFPSEERYAMQLAETFAQKGMRANAISLLEKFVADNEDNANSEMLLAGLYRDNQQEEKARPVLLRLFDDPQVELNSKLIMLGAYNAEYNQRRSRQSRDTDREQFMITLYQKLERQYPLEGNVPIVGGDLFLAVGDTRSAQREYLEAITLGDVNFEVWENLLYIETQLAQWDSVLKHADIALEVYPNQGLIHYLQGNAFVQKKNYEEAIYALEQAKRLASDNAALVNDLNSMLGDVYHATKQYAKSDQLFEECLAVNPNNVTVLNNYSYYLALRKTNLEKAEKMAAQLVKSNPDNATYLDTYAWVLYAAGKYKEAKRIIERAVNVSKPSATHVEHFGDILFKLGDVDGAVVQWEKARGLNGNQDSLNRKIENRKVYE